MIQALTREQKAIRVLLVLYRLSCGAPGIQIKIEDLATEINRLGVMHMSEEEFQMLRENSVKLFSPSQRQN